MPATFHAIKHGHPAALVHLRSHHLPLLNLFLHFAACAADALAIPLSRPVMLPRQRRLWTVPRSPFVHKKSQENFERIIHKRVLKAWDTNPQLIELWEEYLKMHSLAGVGMRIVKWERLPLDVIGDRNRKQLQEVRTDARKVAAIGQKIIDTSSDQVSPPAKVDKKLETRTIPGKKSATEILKELAQSSGRKGRLSIAERKKLEKQTRKEELLRLASEKRAALPDRVEDSLSELDSTVQRALKAIPRYDVIRPAYSAAGDAEAALGQVLEGMRIREREEADLERQKIEQIRHEMASGSTTQTGEQAKASLFAAPSEGMSIFPRKLQANNTSDFFHKIPLQVFLLRLRK
jgi:small subunit ribosomal protein S10